MPPKKAPRHANGRELFYVRGSPGGFNISVTKFSVLAKILEVLLLFTHFTAVSQCLHGSRNCGKQQKTARNGRFGRKKVFSGRHSVDLLETSSSSNPLSPRALTPQFGRHLVDWKKTPDMKCPDRPVGRDRLYFNKSFTILALTVWEAVRIIYDSLS